MALNNTTWVGMSSRDDRGNKVTIDVELDNTTNQLTIFGKTGQHVTVPKDAAVIDGLITQLRIARNRATAELRARLRAVG